MQHACIARSYHAKLLPTCSIEVSNAIYNCMCRRSTRCAAGKPGQPAQDVDVSQALTAIGLSGTVAASGAALCGVDLFQMFHWDRWQDIQLAVALNLPLVLLDAALFLPNYSIPQSLLEQQQQQQQAATCFESDQPHIPPSPSLAIPSVTTCSSWSPDSWLLMLAMQRAAMLKTSVQQLPLQVAAGLLVAREASKELLQRGFFVTALAGWLIDRFYEADVGGLDGFVTLPGGTHCTVPQLGLWLASLVGTAVFCPAAFLAAEEAAEGVGGAMLLRTEAGKAMTAAAAASARSKQREQSSVSASLSSEQPHAECQTNVDTGVIPAVGLQDEVEEDTPLDPEVLEYRLVKVTEACLTSAPVQLTYRLNLAKALGRLVLSNAVFVLTQQNLAASFTSSLLANALLLAYSRSLGGRS